MWTLTLMLILILPIPGFDFPSFISPVFFHSAASICHEWDLAVGHGYSQWTRSEWDWCYRLLPPKRSDDGRWWVFWNTTANTEHASNFLGHGICMQAVRTFNGWQSLPGLSIFYFFFVFFAVINCVSSMSTSLINVWLWWKPYLITARHGVNIRKC